jgi:MoxR-like ATPase
VDLNVNAQGAGTTAREALAAEVDRLRKVKESVARVVIGQEKVVDEVLTALMCGGHVLIESAPGLGKTLLVKSIGTACGMAFSRVQFTPDLMPADITGTIALTQDEAGRSVTRFQPGPIFAQMVLADEINRATPKTQSALLEAMQERTVTVAGKRYELPEPFFVLATQNPIEMEGTYLLPEAQVDRFLFKVSIPFPSQDVLEAIVDTTTGSVTTLVEQVLTPEDILRVQVHVRDVPIADHLRSAVVRFVRSTQPEAAEAGDKVRKYVRFGVSPRGAQSLVIGAKAHALLNGRYAVSREDVYAVAGPALRHRFQLNYEGWADGVDPEALMRELLDGAFAAKA